MNDWIEWVAALDNNLLKFISGDNLVSVLTVKRFFVLHFILGLVVLILILIHLYYLHYYSSTSYLGKYTVNIQSGLLLLIIKDNYTFTIVMVLLYIMGITLHLAHSDNLIEANPMLTPVHILPEWYFLSLYLILKIINGSISGLLIIIVFVFHAIYLTSNLDWLIDYSYTGTANIYATTNYILIYGMLTFLGCVIPTPVLLLYGKLYLILFFYSVLVNGYSIHK